MVFYPELPDFPVFFCLVFYFTDFPDYIEIRNYPFQIISIDFPTLVDISVSLPFSMKSREIRKIKEGVFAKTRNTWPLFGPVTV